VVSGRGAWRPIRLGLKCRRISLQQWQSQAAKLAAKRATAPLFDTTATTRALEAAYTRMRDMHQRG